MTDWISKAVRHATPALASALMAAAMLGGCGAPGENSSQGESPVGVSSRAFADEPLSLVARQSLRERAVEVLLAGATAENAQLRANAIEGLEHVGDRGMSAVRSGLVDDNAGVRSAAAMVAGRRGFEELEPFLRPLLEDPDARVRASAIFALTTLGRDVDRSPLGMFLLESPSPFVRAQAAYVLGELGEKSARPMLRQAAVSSLPRAKPSEVRAFQMQVAEALVRLGEESAISGVRSALYPSAPDELEFTALAAQILGNVQDEASAGQLILLTAYRFRGQTMPASVRLAAAGALGRLGRTEGWFIADEYNGDPDPLVRAQAARVYGWTRGGNNLHKLRAMLDDPNPLVGVAAATAIVEYLEQAAGETP